MEDEVKDLLSSCWGLYVKRQHYEAESWQIGNNTEKMCYFHCPNVKRVLGTQGVGGERVIAA